MMPRNAMLIGDRRFRECPLPLGVGLSWLYGQPSAKFSSLSRRRPLDTRFQTMLIPVVQAILFVNHGEAAKAIEILKAGEAYDKGTTDIHFVRGRADLLNHQ